MAVLKSDQFLLSGQPRYFPRSRFNGARGLLESTVERGSLK